MTYAQIYLALSYAFIYGAIDHASSPTFWAFMAMSAVTILGYSMNRKLGL